MNPQEGVDAEADASDEMPEQEDIRGVKAHVPASRPMIAHLVQRQSARASCLCVYRPYCSWYVASSAEDWKVSSEEGSHGKHVPQREEKPDSQDEDDAYEDEERLRPRRQLGRKSPCELLAVPGEWVAASGSALEKSLEQWRVIFDGAAHTCDQLRVRRRDTAR